MRLLSVNMWFEYDQIGAAALTSAVWLLPGSCGPDVCTDRRVIYDTGGLILEDSRREVAHPLGQGYSPGYQLVFPYFGAFDWRVGREQRLIDANSLLLVSGGEEFTETHPHEQIGHGSAILTVDAELLDEIGLKQGSLWWSATSRPVTDDMRLLVHRLLFAEMSHLAREEMSLLLLRLVAEDEARGADQACRRVVQKAKQILHQHGYEPLSLTQIASQVGVSPIYLTQTFTRSEGMPLYRYQMRLRLARALFELPRRESLIDLALDLGFSSHSHFSSTFRNVFGITPSQFRSEYAGA